jgi:Uncharacterized protein conserved in bacteria (DUF2252)
VKVAIRRYREAMRGFADQANLAVWYARADVAEQFQEPGRPCSRAMPAQASTSHGQRVVVGQRLMQAASDMFLGWHGSRLGPGSTPYDYYIRQLRDWKASAEIAAMTPAMMQAYGELCEWTLARTHARSGDRIAIAAYLGRSTGFDQAIGSSPLPTPTRTSATTAPWRPRTRPGRVPAERDI